MQSQSIRKPAIVDPTSLNLEIVIMASLQKIGMCHAPRSVVRPGEILIELLRQSLIGKALKLVETLELDIRPILYFVTDSWIDAVATPGYEEPTWIASCQSDGSSKIIAEEIEVLLRNLLLKTKRVVVTRMFF